MSARTGALDHVAASSVYGWTLAYLADRHGYEVELVAG